MRAAKSGKSDRFIYEFASLPLLLGNYGDEADTGYAWSLALPCPSNGWSADPAPVKLEVEARAHSLRQGEPLQIQVSLLDDQSASQEARSHLLQARTAQAGRKIRDVAIMTGESSKQWPSRLPAAAVTSGAGTRSCCRAARTWQYARPAHQNLPRVSSSHGDAW